MNCFAIWGTISRVIHSLMDMKFQSYGLKRGQFYLFDPHL